MHKAQHSVPTLPMDLLVESVPMDLLVDILYRLPVKFLVQFRSVCKLWNSVISDHEFAKKHLDLSATCSLNSAFYLHSSRRYIFESRPLGSIFSTISMDHVTQFEYSPKAFDQDFQDFHSEYACYVIGSCNGIICLTNFYDDSYVLVWNPSIRKFKELPPLKTSKFNPYSGWISHGFGHDHVNDIYKVVVVLNYPWTQHWHRQVFSFSETEVKIYTFGGTNLWKSIGEFPFGCVPLVGPSATFACGAINWLASKNWDIKTLLIVSFNLNNESFQEILQPDYGEVGPLSLGVLRDCLCMISGNDVWLMKEYGNKESWTKLLTISYNQDPRNSYSLAKAICMFADDQVLFESSSDSGKMLIYDLKTATFKFIDFQNKMVKDPWDWNLQVCTESLIFP